MTGFITFFVKMSPINFLKNEKSYIFADQKFRYSITQIIISEMTKADIVNEIAKKTGIDKNTVLVTLEAFMGSVTKKMST